MKSDKKKENTENVNPARPLTFNRNTKQLAVRKIMEDTERFSAPPAHEGIEIDAVGDGTWDELEKRPWGFDWDSRGHRMHSDDYWPEG